MAYCREPQCGNCQQAHPWNTNRCLEHRNLLRPHRDPLGVCEFWQSRNLHQSPWERLWLPDIPILP